MTGTTPPQSDSKIVVYNFPPVPHVYSVCPFAIKLESFLRINKIPHQTIYTTQFSSQFTMPYCHFGEEEVSDSNVVIGRIFKEYDVTDTTVLSPMERAITHTTIRMLEEHTAQIGFYYRYGLDMKNFLDSLDVGDRFGQKPEFTQKWLEVQPKTTKEKTQKRGLTRHSDEAIWQFSNDDLQALSDLLGEKKYFFGKEVPTLMDCAVFGHLSQFLWIPIDFPQRKFVEDECPNLIRFMENFRKEYWADWEECCKKQPNQKYAKQQQEQQSEPADESTTSAGCADGGVATEEEKKE